MIHGRKRRWKREEKEIKGRQNEGQGRKEREERKIEQTIQNKGGQRTDDKRMKKKEKTIENRKKRLRQKKEIH